MSSSSSRRTAAVLMILAAVLANAAFVGLGAAFNYPDVLQEPATEILAAYTGSQTAINAWFLALALGAGLMAPIAVLLTRAFPGPRARVTMWVGVAAAAVQVIGLLRWPLLVPGFAANGDTASFSFYHAFLGSFVGETCGYALTAAWTLLAGRVVGSRVAGKWFRVVGDLSALLIGLGVLIPLGVPFTDEANFVGYVLWSVWLITFGALLLRREARYTAAV